MLKAPIFKEVGDVWKKVHGVSPETAILKQLDNNTQLLMSNAQLSTEGQTRLLES